MVWEEMSFEEFQDGSHGGILDIEQNSFSTSESLCHSDASHQVSAQSNLWFGEERELTLELFICLFDLRLFGFVGFLFHLVFGKGCGL